MEPIRNFMLPEVRTRYGAVLCAEACSSRVGKCFRCSKPLKAGESTKAEICNCCVPSKRLKCTKCKRAIITQNFPARVCNHCFEIKGDTCVVCSNPFERKSIGIPITLGKKEEQP